MQEKKIKKNPPMESRIDTIQTKEKVSNREELKTEIKGMGWNINNKGELITIWNPNNSFYEYSSVYKLSETERGLQKLMEFATVINPNECEKNRIDIATDNNIDFIEQVKLIELLHKCLVAQLKGGKSWTNIDNSDNKYSNFRFKNRDFNIEFYDKNKESEGRSKYITRFEVRRLRVKAQDLKYHIDECISLWSGAINNLELVNKEEFEKIRKDYDKEKKDNLKMTFTTFINRHHREIFTMEQLKELYKYSGLKGNFNGWLRDFRKCNSLTLVTKKDLETTVKEVIKSLKTYKKL